MHMDINFAIFIDYNEFQNEILYDLQNGKKYCFLIGSGASVSSKIPMGRDMVKEWFDELREGKKPEEFKKDIQKRICEVLKKHDITEREELGKKLGKYIDFEYVPDIRESQEDYNYIYELRFAYDEIEGQRYFLEKSDSAIPNIGYISIAEIVCNCPSANIIVTTNFDELIDFAITYYQGKKAFSIDHERMADLALEKMTSRPQILRPHRGVAYGGLNKADETKELDERWKKALREVFSEYIPIVVGYSGTDKDIMDFLKMTKIENIYWCYRYGSLPSKDVQELIEKKRGRLVAIYDSDQFFFDIKQIFINKEKAFIEKMYDGSRATYRNNQRLNKTKKQIKSKNKEFYVKTNELIREIYIKNEPKYRLSSLCLFSIGNMLESASLMEHAIDKEEKEGHFYARGYYELGKLYCRRKKYSEAARQFEIMLKNENSNYYEKACALKNLYDIALISEESIEKRLKLLENILKIEPANKKCQNYLFELKNNSNL